MTRCFMIEPSGDVSVESIYMWLGCTASPYALVGSVSYHHMGIRQFTGPEAEAVLVQEDKERMWAARQVICEHCGVDGGIMRADSTAAHTVWVRPDTGQRADNIRTFGIGAMYRAHWQHYGDRVNAQGIGLYGFDWDNLTEPPLHVVTPGGEWNIDSRASNCTMPNDKLHRCWVRHGEPPLIHVDKAGHTCAAGAGSILCGSYHGFLHNGSLT